MAERVASPHEYTKCFDGPFAGQALEHCAADGEVLMSAKGHCFWYERLADAQQACLRLQTCNGVVQTSRPDTAESYFVLKSGETLHVRISPPGAVDAQMCRILWAVG